MNRFWNLVTLPILKEVQAKRIVEIGSEYGAGTKKVLEYVKSVNGNLTSIDPFPLFDFKRWEKEFAPHFNMIEGYSLDAISRLGDMDAVLLDGDHNWYTVYHELLAIEKQVGGKKFPIVFLHDIAWPYGRRDLYYDPTLIPDEFRQPYAKKGMKWEQNELCEEGGINRGLFNATEENTPRNGVLTGVEDFMEKSSFQFELIQIPFFHGFGILIEKNNHELIEFAKGLIVLPELFRLVEEERIAHLFTIQQKISDDESMMKVLDGKYAVLNREEGVLWGIIDNQSQVIERYRKSFKWIVKLLACGIRKKDKRKRFRRDYMC